MPTRFLQLTLSLTAILVFVVFAATHADAQKNRRSLLSPLQVIQEKYRDRAIEFSKAIDKLATECDEQGFKETADLVRESKAAPDSQSLKVTKLPSEIQSEIPSEIMGAERNLRNRLKILKTEYAKSLFQFAKMAVKQEFPGYGFDLIREAAHYDPDNPNVRQVLGYVRLKNQWVTSFAAKQIREEKKIWNEQFGWLPATHEQKYESGERYFQGRWVSAEKEKTLRQDFKNAWEVQTDHYIIKTNVSLEKGVAMGKSLEDFYEVFHETFASFFNTHEQLKKLFEGKGKAIGTRQYTVHCYRTKGEYVDRMKKFFPSIEQTNGVYLTNDRIAHFFDDPDQEHDDTLFHEATHQLFYEIDRQNRPVAEKHHFWIVEGIACYMESFRRGNGEFRLGEANHIRFLGARRNLLQDKYYVPLREFSGFSAQEFQYAAERAKYYTQASGLARFFLHYDNGRYREALVTHLSQLYNSNSRRRDDVDGLDELTGVDFEELDRQYAEDAMTLDKTIVKK